MRPVIAINSDSMGPLTSGPLPCDQSASDAFSRSPAIRDLVPMIMFEPLKKSASSSTASGGYACAIPRARRMSSAWMMVSPSMVSFGPGGRFSDATIASKSESVSAPEVPRFAAIPLACRRSKLNREAISLGKNVAGVIWAVPNTVSLVVAGVDVDTDQGATFGAFTDPTVFSRWLGVPVSIVDGTFACTMEWGTQVRGRYEIVSPPDLIALRWDFEDDVVPVPGTEMTGYVRFSPAGKATHVEVHQLVDTAAQAEFMEGAWALVLGRLKAGVARALDRQAAVGRRSRRPKRRGSA